MPTSSRYTTEQPYRGKPTVRCSVTNVMHRITPLLLSILYYLLSGNRTAGAIDILLGSVERRLKNKKFLKKEEPLS